MTDTNFYGGCLSKNAKRSSKDTIGWLSTLQESIPLKSMYEIFSDHYFNNNEIDKADINIISSKINSLLKKNYPNHYKMLTEIRNKNLKDLERSKKDKDQDYESMKRLENQIDTKILITKDAKVDPVNLISRDMVTFGRIVPKDWYERLANESGEKQK